MEEIKKPYCDVCDKHVSTNGYYLKHIKTKQHIMK
jgi:hypothetical protein